MKKFIGVTNINDMKFLLAMDNILIAAAPYEEYGKHWIHLELKQHCGYGESERLQVGPEDEDWVWEHTLNIHFSSKEAAQECYDYFKNEFWK